MNSVTNRVRPERKDIWKVGLAMLLVFSIIVLYAFEVSWFSLTFDIKSLLKRSFLIGGILGIFGGAWMIKKGTNNLEKFQLFLLFFFLISLSMPLFGSLTNRLLSRQTVVQEKLEFGQIQPYGQSRFGVTKEGIKVEGYFIFFVRNSRMERIKSSVPYFQEIKRSEMIKMPIKKGFWGYDFVLLEAMEE